jgi:hypothetical protein
MYHAGQIRSSHRSRFEIEIGIGIEDRFNPYAVAKTPYAVGWVARSDTQHDRIPSTPLLKLIYAIVALSSSPGMVCLFPRTIVGFRCALPNRRIRRFVEKSRGRIFTCCCPAGATCIQRFPSAYGLYGRERSATLCRIRKGVGVPGGRR